MNLRNQLIMTQQVRKENRMIQVSRLTITQRETMGKRSKHKVKEMERNKKQMEQIIIKELEEMDRKLK